MSTIATTINSSTSDRSDEGQVFEYTPLEDASVHIRLLKVMPADSDDPIRCVLSHASVKHEYTCLSYCWGPEQPTRSILVNDTICTVRSNLYSFLLTARSQGITGPLWIDAICINQSHNEEKASQVQIMGTIYAQAAKTIIWCGLPDQAMSCLYQLACTVAVHWNDLVRSDHVNMQHLSLLESEAFVQHLDDMYEEVRDHSYEVGQKPWYSSSHRAAQKFFKNCRAIWCLLTEHLALLTSFVTAEYWQRTWVVQELVLSHNPIVLASGKSLPVKLLLSLAVMFRDFLETRDKLQVAKSVGAMDRDVEIDEYIRQSLRVSTLRPDVGQQPSNEFLPIRLHRVFQLTHETHCHDVRDHAFSLLSLIDESQRFPVDYTKTKEQVFYDATSAYVRDILRSSTWREKQGWLELFAEMLYKDLELSTPIADIGTLPTIWTQIEHLSSPTEVWKSPFWADSSSEQRLYSKKTLQSDRQNERDLCFLIELSTADWVLVAFRMGSPRYQIYSPFGPNPVRAWRRLDGMWQPLPGVDTA